MKKTPQKIMPILPSNVGLPPWIKEKKSQTDKQKVINDYEQLDESNSFFDEFSGYKSYRKSIH